MDRFPPPASSRPSNRFFAPGAEFARVESMFPASRFVRDARGLGDDGFVWDPDGALAWVAASDASVEGVHYRLDWATPAQAVRKALLANLSDVNAMGGRTRMALFNLGARADWEPPVFADLGAALRELERAHGFVTAGGDTTTAPPGGGSFFSFAVMGTIEGAPLLRGGVRPGHDVFVSGTLGGSSAGLAWFGKNAPSSAAGWAAREAHLNPAPPLALGPALARLAGDGRSVGAIDVSDGLSSELWHLARASGCALRIDAARVPRHPALAGLPPDEALGHALHGGEEYQLLFTGSFTPQELARLRAIGPVTRIGRAEEGDGVFLREDSSVRPLAAGGWSHGTG